MSLEHNNNTSLLESIKEWDTFSLSHQVQALCFDEESFQAWDILKIINRSEKLSDTRTVGISFSIKRDGYIQDHVMSLGVFVNNFNNKLLSIDPQKDKITQFTQSTAHRINTLVVNS
jgi:hypothetical protein